MAYRAVSDYGYSDKSWISRGLTEQEAVEWFNEQYAANYTTAQQCMNHNTYIYYIEEDNPDDVEDWDWMDS